MPVDLSTALHIVPGDSAADTFRQTFPELRAQMIVHGDMLATGPCPFVADLASWKTVRSEYWRDWIDDAYPMFEVIDNIDRIGAVPAAVLWIGVGAADQLLLASLVHSLKANGHSADNLHTLQFVGGADFPILSIGELSGDVLRNKAPPTCIIDTDALEQAVAFWRAYSSANPDDLAVFARTTSAGHVQTAAQAILERYPKQSDGLGSWAERLLRNVEARGPRAVSVVGYTMGEIETVDWLGDLELFERLLALAEGRSPLVEIQGNSTDMRDCAVSLTTAGVSVLKGLQNAILLNGIDEWIGGVHLTDQAVAYREQLAAR